MPLLHVKCTGMFTYRYSLQALSAAQPLRKFWHTYPDAMLVSDILTDVF